LLRIEIVSAAVALLLHIHGHLIVVHWWWHLITAHRRWKELTRRRHHERIRDYRLNCRQYSGSPCTTHLSVRIPDFRITVSIGTIFSELALPFLYKELASLGFVVVIGDVHHLHLHFYWQRLL
jgi:hypothetical protein